MTRIPALKLPDFFEDLQRYPEGGVFSTLDTGWTLEDSETQINLGPANREWMATCMRQRVSETLCEEIRLQTMSALSVSAKIGRFKHSTVLMMASY